MSQNIINQKNIRYFNGIETIDNGLSILKSYIGDDVNFRNDTIWMLKVQKLVPKYVLIIIVYSLSNNDLWMKYKIINEKNLRIIHEIELPKNYVSIKRTIDVIKLIKKAFQFITMIPTHRRVLELCTGIQYFYEVVGNIIWK